MLNVRHYALIALAFVMLTTNAEARNHAWFVSHIKPGSQCSGHPSPTTYYGEGRRNADGSNFNRNGLSAASWDYPFGTVLSVTNCNNGRTVQVTIKDRGPARYIYNMGIKLDLSYGAARALALGQNGRFESGYTTHSVVSYGVETVSARRRVKRQGGFNTFRCWTGNSKFVTAHCWTSLDVAARPAY